jgi:TatD DNase family protein
MNPADFRYFDIHSHLNFPQFDADREAVIAEMAKEKIGTITVGTNLKTSEEAAALAETCPHLFASVGIHPLEADTAESGKKFDFERLASLLKNERVVAVGECGLDYSRLAVDPKTASNQKHLQTELFERQIDLAVEFDKPLIIHCRDAYPDALAILTAKKQRYGERLRGDFHFFTSPIDIARQCLGLGFYISFTGPITFTADYDGIVEYVPLEKMMAETDSPYAAPAPYRGKRNSPLYITEITAKIAAVRGQSVDTISKILCNNVFELFFRKS